MYTAHIAYLSACLRSIKAQVLTTRIFPTSRTAQSEPRRSETPHAKRLSSTFKVTRRTEQWNRRSRAGNRYRSERHRNRARASAVGFILLLLAVAFVEIMEAGRFGRGVAYCAPVARHPAALVDAGLPIPSRVRLHEAEDDHQSHQAYLRQRPFETIRTRHESAADCDRCSTS